jgi:large subunit ribosomal protein L25
MKHPQLQAEARTVLGKKVKKLRREGILPANVYGKGLESKAIQVQVADFQKVYKESGDTGLIDLSFDGKTKPVLVKSMHKNYDMNIPLHVDFYQVNLKVAVKTVVPVVLIGEAQAVTEKTGMLLQNLSDVEVEALPDKLPENVEVNVEHLAAVGDQVTVADLKVAEGVTVLTDPTQTIARVNELTVAEPEPEEAPEGEEGAEGAEGEAKEGETTEGEAKEENAEGASEENKE